VWLEGLDLLKNPMTLGIEPVLKYMAEVKIQVIA
jgi:hypothetical protein